MQITWQDLLKDINDIPVVDVHSHLKFGRFEAENLSSVCLYHMLGYELKSSGYKEDSEAEPYSNMEAAAPYYKFIRNSSFHWCMMRVLNDLYGFEEETITEKNWKKAWDLVESKAKPGFPDEVRKKYGIKKILTNEFDSKNVRKARQDNVFMCMETGLWTIDDAERTNVVLDKLGGQTGIEIKSLSSLKEAVSLSFNGIEWESLHGTGTWIRATADFSRSDETTVNQIITKYVNKEEFNDRDDDILNSYLLDMWLDLLKDKDIPYQIAQGCCRRNGEPIAHTSHDSMQSLAYLFAKYPGIHFNILLGAECHNHDINTIAKAFPNVSFASVWWHNFYPSIMRRILKDRLEMVPITKIVGYFTDARCIDWAYARLKLTRLVLAQALSELINEGFYTSSQALQFAEEMMWNNPHRIWKKIGTEEGL